MSKNLIKRYANRKLYDTALSRYITLDRISDMLKSGQEVEVVDSKTGDDLTAVTLAQVMFEQEKKATQKPRLAALQDAIMSGQEAFGDFYKKKVADRVQFSLAAINNLGQMAAEVKNLRSTIAELEKRIAALEAERK
jgi:polyhydroxyalkanoate synthesis repressor PhaR